MPLWQGKDPAALRWYVQSELVHGRTAMAAVAGILIPGVSVGARRDAAGCNAGAGRGES
jgi:hypothetical protein